MLLRVCFPPEERRLPSLNLSFLIYELETIHKSSSASLTVWPKVPKEMVTFAHGAMRVCQVCHNDNVSVTLSQPLWKLEIRENIE